MRYQGDLSDSQWDLLSGYFSVGNYGNRRKHSVRELVNATLYLVESGCQWRMLPKDFPPFSTVFTFYSRCKARGIWEKINDDLIKMDRLKNGSNASPSFGIIDSQSTKTTGAAECRGIDGGKKIKGRKCHIVVDTEGHMLYVKVHAANVHDTIAGGVVFEETTQKYPTLLGVCGDDGYRGTFVNFVTNTLHKTVKISKRISKTWAVIAKRWIVERTFSWLNHFRRLAKDFEISTRSEENIVIIAHLMTLIQRF